MSVLLKYNQHNTNNSNYKQHKYKQPTQVQPTQVQPTHKQHPVQPTKAHPVLLTVKHFNHAVLAGTEKVMGAWDKTNAHDGVGMGKHRFVAISKIQTPDFHVLVAAGGHQQGVVGRDVHGHHRQFVPVPVYDKLWWWWWWSVVAVVMVFQKEGIGNKNRRKEEQKKG